MTNQNQELKQNEIEITVTHSLEHYKNHCEFLGYSIEEDDEDSIICNHSRRDRLRLIRLSHDVGVLAQVFYVLPDKLASDPLSLFSYANELNSMFIFMKACVRGMEDLRPYIILSSVLEGDYSRKNFAIFLENLYHDLELFHDYPKTVDLFRSRD